MGSSCRVGDSRAGPSVIANEVGVERLCLKILGIKLEFGWNPCFTANVANPKIPSTLWRNFCYLSWWELDCIGASNLKLGLIFALLFKKGSKCGEMRLRKHELNDHTFERECWK